jgi:hypothetical protein
LLWKLINEGHRIPGWLIGYTIWDLVEIEILPSGKYKIGTRGIGYEGFENTLESFKLTCEYYSLHFIDNTKI